MVSVVASSRAARTRVSFGHGEGAGWVRWGVLNVLEVEGVKACLPPPPAPPGLRSHFGYGMVIAFVAIFTGKILYD